MRVLICGKGGSGKSTLSALIATALKDRGYSVLLVDADESNFGLHRLLGIPYPVSLLDSLGGKKGFKEKRSSAFPQTIDGIPFKEKARINQIPEACIAQTDGIKLLVIGKIHHFGEGCACPMGMLSKMFLSKLDFAEKEIVIIDTAAGVEHFGRGVDGDCDMILDVVDPTFESLELTKKMQDMAIKAGVEIYFVLNKVDKNLREAMTKQMGDKTVIAAIPQNHDIFMTNLKGEKLATGFHETDPICRLIENYNRKTLDP